MTDYVRFAYSTVSTGLRRVVGAFSSKDAVDPTPVNLISRCGPLPPLQAGVKEYELDAAPSRRERVQTDAVIVDWFNTLDMFILLSRRGTGLRWITEKEFPYESLPQQAHKTYAADHRRSADWVKYMFQPALRGATLDESTSEAPPPEYIFKECVAFWDLLNGYVDWMIKERQLLSRSGTMKMYIQGGAGCYWYFPKPLTPERKYDAFDITLTVPTTSPAYGDLSYTINHYVFNHRHTAAEKNKEATALGVEPGLIEDKYLVNLPSQWILLHEPGQPLSGCLSYRNTELTIGPTLSGLYSTYELHTVLAYDTGTQQYHTLFTSAWLEQMAGRIDNASTRLDVELWEIRRESREYGKALMQVDASVAAKFHVLGSYWRVKSE